MPIILDGTLGITTPALTVTGATVNTGGISTAGNLTFTSTGNRILGDMNNATISSRLAFQTSVTNSSSVLNILPNGTSVASGFSAFGNSDPTNTSTARFVNIGSEAAIQSGIVGTGTYTPLTMYTGGAERLRIDTSGNVGIGTSSPAYKLDTVTQGATATSYIASRNTSATGAFGAGFLIQSGANANNFSAITHNTTGDFTIANAAGGYQAFVIGATERMRITSAGFLLIATTSFFGTGISMSSPDSSGIYTNSSINTTVNHYRFANGNGTVGSITTNGSATLYNVTSDYRLKTVVGSVTNSGQRIDALEPIEYDWKSGGRTRGFLAHKFAEVYPNSVSGKKDAVDLEGKPVYQAMQASTPEVMADLIAEIQSLRKRIATLEAK